MPIRICQEPKCGSEVAYRGRCRRHARGRERETHRNRSVYNSAKWKRTRERQLFAHPLCSVCGTVADQVDHVVPIEKGGDIWAFANLQSLCLHCHSCKTRSEQQAA